ncbi:hypothetical protein PoB_006784600 [Plakobranchus ocellatus]|uniref:Uncharacterized protein n=1 Tax=Plakobranchus ocellatus TaxID=259542 RepID=A0AAV4DBN4_9GAST|nr:hypothetical protein PoB_006784600 [Plakobranchus ocellatus]
MKESPVYNVTVISLTDTVIDLIRNTDWPLPLATPSIRCSHTNFQFLCFYFLVGRYTISDVTAEPNPCQLPPSHQNLQEPPHQWITHQPSPQQRPCQL